MVFPVQRWLKTALINLLIVAILGVILRYKILYTLPFIDQKHLLHGHSHFAFAGWITQALMILMVAYLSKDNNGIIYKRYKWLLYANLFTAYGMLVAFPIEGYGLFSIIFSSASVLVSYIFAIFYWRDISKQPVKLAEHLWFKAGVAFNAFSSIGVFALTIMMLSNVKHQNWYIAAEYFYLHFQYNGWFFFACMGLFTGFIAPYKIPQKKPALIFWLFGSAAVPAYFLSTLWMDLALPLYIIVVLSAFAQVAGYIVLLNILKTKWKAIQAQNSKTATNIILLSAIALAAKLLLQLGSTIPSLSDLAFGFRPIVVGYLHLVLLGVITLFLLGFIFVKNHFSLTGITARGIYLFSAAVVLNEILLMVQGVAAITYTWIPYINQMLLFTALLLFAGALLISFSKKIFFKNDFNHSLPFFYAGDLK